MDTDTAPFMLDEVILRVCDMTMRGSMARELECLIDIDPSTPLALLGDAGRLQQILTNLMGNAVKFTPPGGRIHLQVRHGGNLHLSENQNKAQFLFFVHDTGVGIAPDQLPQLFQPFKQADSSLTRRHGGTGLGLAIARVLVQHMGGTIHVRSVVGKGSTFSFTLRFRRPAAVLKEAESTAPGNTPAPLDGLRVLLAEDNDINQIVATEILKMKGIAVDVASNGLEAVDMARSGAYDVILMDIQMPGSDGLGAAERILGAHKHARIVFLTTFSDDEYIVRALRLGAKGYLIKQEVATIAPALRTVMAGQSVLGGEVLDRMDVLMSRGPACAENAPGGEMRSGLTERESAIVELVAEGLDNKEIAARLYLSEGTVRNHISAILREARSEESHPAGRPLLPRPLNETGE